MQQRPYRAAAPLTAVDRVSLSLPRGGTLGLVGESGCGKSSLGKAAMRLVPADSGAIRLDGVDIASLGASALKPFRPRMQIMFQDALGALDPRRTVRQSLVQPLVVQGRGFAAQRRIAVDRQLEAVGLSPAIADRHPHEFSGCQRQRINLALALMLEPDVLVCDEPVSALDVSLQAQVLNLLRDLQQARGMACLFISHDLAVVAYMADRIAVMYLGAIVEMLPRERLWDDSAHPYTRMLVGSVPGTGVPPLAPSAQELPHPYEMPAGCRFHDRCPHAVPCCETPPPRRFITSDHWVDCHF